MVSEGKVPPVSDGPASGDGGRSKPEADFAGDSFADASRHVADAISFGLAYLMAQADRFKAIARNAILMAVFGIVAAIIVATILVSATVMLCVGVAGGIGALLGGRQWAGDLITGGIVVGGLLLCGRLVISKIVRAARDRTRMEYEQRRSRN